SITGTSVAVSALVTSPYMIVAGLIGSVLVAAVGSVPGRPIRPAPSARLPRSGSVPAAASRSHQVGPNSIGDGAR
ncbi:MAG TPA: hypothetical protein VF163_20385, partial [Micromonosporaceae bacterium]